MTSLLSGNHRHTSRTAWLMSLAMRRAYPRGNLPAAGVIVRTELTRRFAMIRIQVAVVLALFAAGARPAQADAAKPTFESLDKNSDGKVSLNEAAENDALFVA